MNVAVVMPQLGLTMEEGTVREWLKKPGEPVQKGEALFVVSTDKADMDVESLEEGTLAQIVVESGRTVPVRTVIAYINRLGEQAEVGLPHAGPANVATPARELIEKVDADVSEHGPEILAPQRERPLASPRARRLARELGIDISIIKGRAGGGRIVEADVRASVAPAGAVVVVPDIRRRKLIAERLTKSIQTIPHFSVSVEVDASKLILSYELLKGTADNVTGLKLTLSDLLLKCLGMALVKVPQMMAIWDGAQGPVPGKLDLGLAIATQRGVVAPIIQDVDKLDLSEIAARRSQLVEKSLQGRLSLSDLEGGVGTLSNLGMYAIDAFQAIITPDQSFILAVGRIGNHPWVEGTSIVVRPTVVLNLCVDHRIADGAVAAQFLEQIVEVIENPSQIFGSLSASGLM